MKRLSFLIVLFLGLASMVQGQIVYLYWFDNNDATLQTGLSNSSSWVNEVNVSGLTEGLHLMHIQVRHSNDQTWSSPQSLFFYFQNETKRPIIQYDYWVNDYIAGTTNVSIAEPASTLTIEEDLEVGMCPIRSAAFAVEPDGEQMMVYAVNDLHLRVYDSEGGWDEAEGRFTDHRVSQDITNSPLLTTGETYTATVPETDGITWMRIAASPRDNLQLQADRACTLQLFSPYGEELLNVSGNDVKSYQEAFVYDEGYYYLALHDVTDGSGETVNVDLQQSAGAGDLYYRMTLATEGHGTITYNGQTIADGESQAFRVKEETTVSLTLQPEDEYILGSLYVNGIDCKDDVSEGVLMLSSLTGATSITATFIPCPYKVLTMASTATTFCCTRDLDFSDVEGLKAYIIPSFDRETGNLVALRVNSVPAGTGLLIKATEPGEYHIP